jgi:pimeloyl-ACP methyl ester carboxylesterase
VSSFVLVHGAWHQGSAWDLVRPLLEARGHFVGAPSLTARPGTRLRDHVREIEDAVARAAASGPVTVVAHSYGGIPAAAASASAGAERLVLLDAWLAPAGHSLLDVAPDWFAAWCRDSAAGDPPMLPVPPLWTVGVPDDAPEAAWLAPRLVEHPLATFTDPVETPLDPDGVDLHAVVCTPSSMPFRAFAEGAGAAIREIASGHDVMVTEPAQLAALLDEIA